MLGFNQFTLVKNNYCLSYYGLLPEYISQLKILRQILKKTYSGTNLFISCRDEFLYLLENEENIISNSKIHENKNSFAYHREFYTRMNSHSILEFAKECNVNSVSRKEKEKTTGICLICPDGGLPTKSINKIDQLKDYAKKEGYSVIVVGSDLHLGETKVDVRPSESEKLKYIKRSDWIVGVENEFLFEGIFQNKKTTLIETGIGRELYQLLSNNKEVISGRTIGENSF
jgi:hypothetical protein